MIQNVLIGNFQTSWSTVLFLFLNCKLSVPLRDCFPSASSWTCMHDVEETPGAPQPRQNTKGPVSTPRLVVSCPQIQIKITVYLIF